MKSIIVGDIFPFLAPQGSQDECESNHFPWQVMAMPSKEPKPWTTPEISSGSKWWPKTGNQVIQGREIWGFSMAIYGNELVKFRGAAQVIKLVVYVMFFGESNERCC